MNDLMLQLIIVVAAGGKYSERGGEYRQAAGAFAKR
jgi:hypothetical protein